MSEGLSNLPANHRLEVSSFGKSPALSFDMTNIRVAESRIPEVERVNVSTYVNLEHTFNAAYRELKNYLSQVGYAKAMAAKAIDEAKADVILGSYADFMQGKPKYTDNSHMREAFITKDPAYTAAYEHHAKLQAMEEVLDGKIKVLENVCRYMRKKMDLILRNGPGENYRPTSGGGVFGNAK